MAVDEGKYRRLRDAGFTHAAALDLADDTTNELGFDPETPADPMARVRLGTDDGYNDSLDIVFSVTSVVLPPQVQFHISGSLLVAVPANQMVCTLPQFKTMKDFTVPYSTLMVTSVSGTNRLYTNTNSTVTVPTGPSVALSSSDFYFEAKIGTDLTMEASGVRSAAGGVYHVRYQADLDW